jgi:hypothetical protein
MRWLWAATPAFRFQGRVLKNKINTEQPHQKDVNSARPSGMRGTSGFEFLNPACQVPVSKLTYPSFLERSARLSPFAVSSAPYIPGSASALALNGTVSSVARLSTVKRTGTLPFSAMRVRLSNGESGSREPLFPGRRLSRAESFGMRLSKGQGQLKSEKERPELASR